MYNEAAAKRFFEAFNAEMEAAFERITADIDPQRFDDPDLYTQIRHATLNSMQQWNQIPLDAIQGLTPEQYIDGLQGTEDLLRFVRLAARFCDEELPELLKIRLGREVETLLPLLRDLATQVSYASAETGDEILEASAAIKLLGEWQDLSFIQVFVDRFIEAGEPQELITDAGQYFFEQLGQEGLDAIQEILIDLHREKAAYTSSYEYLLVFLTQLGREYRQTDIYPLLRTAFRQSERKVIAAICIGDYGDARGVVLLRSYIIEHEKEIDRQLYYESLSSIKRLGGSTKDLPDPFRDFSGQSGFSGFPEFSD